jgi:hypothetical protein
LGCLGIPWDSLESLGNLHKIPLEFLKISIKSLWNSWNSDGLLDDEKFQLFSPWVMEFVVDERSMTTWISIFKEYVIRVAVVFATTELKSYKTLLFQEKDPDRAPRF